MHPIFFATIVSVAVPALLSPLAIQRFPGLHLVDKPSTLSIHKRVIPTAGGLVILAGFLVGINTAWLLGIELPVTTEEFLTLQGLIILVTVLGLLDDLRPLRASPKLLVIFAAGLLFALFVSRIQLLTIPFFAQVNLNTLWSIALTVIWIVVTTSAINIIDGLDGLLSSYALVYFVVMSMISLTHDTGGSLYLSSVMAGAVLVFYFFNKPPAQIFLGNAGSHMLGFIIAISPLLGHNKAAAAISMAPVMILLIYPILDLSVQFVRRLLRGKNPFKGDTLHFHHICFYLNRGRSRYLMWLNLLFIVNGSIALLSMIVSPSWRILILAATLLANLVVIISTILSVRHVDPAELRARREEAEKDNRSAA